MSQRRALILGLSLLMGSCSNTTGGSLILLPFRIGGPARDATQPFTFTTAKGWTVQLDQALIATGPFYFNVSVPPTDQPRGGVVIAEVTQQLTVNVLDPTLQEIPNGVDGETGHAIAVEVQLLPPDAQQSDDSHATLQAGCAYVAGSATNGTTTVPFAGQVVIDNSIVPASTTLDVYERVRGASTDLVFTDAPQALVTRIDPSHWFDYVDFTPLGKDTAHVDDQGRHGWVVQSLTNVHLVQGLKTETGVYQFTLEPR
jgi:hypothetical protein